MADTSSENPVEPDVLPSDFGWGVSTSSYQIEGAAREDVAGIAVGAQRRIAKASAHWYARMIRAQATAGVR